LLLRYALRLARAAARNFAKFNQAAVDLKILSAHCTPMYVYSKQGEEILTPAAVNKTVNSAPAMRTKLHKFRYLQAKRYKFSGADPLHAASHFFVRRSAIKFK